MTEKKELGNIGEDLCCNYLKSRGYQIIKRNFNCRFGEIDVIARSGGFLVFIEVKLRTNDRKAAYSSISRQKKLRIIKAARSFISKHHEYENNFTRFDAVIVSKIAGSDQYAVRHLPDAFRTDEVLDPNSFL
jgi:putative endonuclease